MRAALLAALLLTGCATARLAPTCDQATRTCWAEPEDVARACWDRGGRGFGINGCFDFGDGVTLLPYPHRVGASHYREIVNHEHCHALGWAADHSGARPKGCR